MKNSVFASSSPRTLGVSQNQIIAVAIKWELKKMEPIEYFNCHNLIVD